MSSSFPTLEEGMRIILDLLFLQEPFAFPTSCSLQLHWCWALLRTQLSTEGLRPPTLGVNPAGLGRLPTERGEWASALLPGAPSPSPGCKPLIPESGERVVWADVRGSIARSSFLFFSAPKPVTISIFFALFCEILQPCHESG